MSLALVERGVDGAAPAQPLEVDEAGEMSAVCSVSSCNRTQFRSPGQALPLWLIVLAPKRHKGAKRAAKGGLTERFEARSKCEGRDTVWQNG